MEQIERRVLADRQVAATLIAAGVKIDLPDPDKAREAFDRELLAEPVQVDSTRRALLEALGVADAG